MINFTVGDSIFIDDREHEFFNFVPNDSGSENSAPHDLQFRDKLNHLVRMFSRKEFDALYLAGKLRWKLPIERKGDGVSEEFCHDGPLRTLRQHFTQAFDAKPVPKTDAALEKLLSEVLSALGLSEEEWGRSGGTLRRWINDRGEIGNRPRKCMGDRRHRGPRGPRMHPTALEVLAAKSERYWVNRRVTAKDIYAEVRVALVGANTERQAKGLKPIPVPGRCTVWRWLTTHSDYDNTRRRFGARFAGRRFMPLKGSLETKRILDIAIMDHTVLDCFVVDDTRFIPVGRPYLTFVIDVRSRYPLAYVLGYTPPSVETAMACLRRAVRPKPDINERFPDIRGEWVAYGVPRTVLVDNAWEFSGSSFRDACVDSGISVEWAPVRTPEYKGIGERFFRTLNQELVHKLHGAVPARHVLKEYGIDPAAEAVLLLSEIEELICQVVIEVYGNDFHQGIKAVPEQVWRTRQAIDGIDYAANLKALDRSFGKLGGERKLSRAGIEHKNLTYRSEVVRELLDELLPREPKRGRSRDTVAIKFKYWPEDLSKIAVWNAVRLEYVDLPCTQPVYARGLSEHHHDVLSRYAVEQSLKFSTEDERCAARVRLNEKISSFVNNRKIGDRRRAQRIIPKNENSETAYQRDTSKENIIPIETVSNRVAGDQPARGPVRKGRQTVARPSQSKHAAVPEVSGSAKDKSTPVTALDPFAGIDRQALLSKIGKEDSDGAD